MKQHQLNIILSIGLILMAGAARILNHEMGWWNLAPVGALGLFCGSVFKDKRYAYLFPILAQLIGDVYVALFTNWQGFYGVDQAGVYAALIAVTYLGTRMRQPKWFRVLGFSLGASLVFFILSNFGVWLAIETGKQDLFHYGTGWTGLVNTYAAALPFFKNSLRGDLIGCVLLFGGYFLLQRSYLSNLQKTNS